MGMPPCRGIHRNVGNRRLIAICDEFLETAANIKFFRLVQIAAYNPSAFYQQPSIVIPRNLLGILRHHRRSLTQFVIGKKVDDSCNDMVKNFPCIIRASLGECLVFSYIHIQVYPYTGLDRRDLLDVSQTLLFQRWPSVKQAVVPVDTEQRRGISSFSRHIFQFGDSSRQV